MAMKIMLVLIISSLLLEYACSSQIQAVYTENQPVAQQPIHFAIVVPTFPRKNDRHYLLPRYTVFASIVNQTYPHWTLILVADAISENRTQQLLESVAAAQIPKDKFIFKNLPGDQAERNVYTTRQ